MLDSINIFKTYVDYNDSERIYVRIDQQILETNFFITS